MRSAMMRQTLLTPSPFASARAASAGADVPAGGISALRMAPPGPEPRSAPRSRPRSAARRRALGEAAGSRTATPREAAPLPEAGARCRSTWARTSAFSIFPPAAFTWVRSTPCSAASFRASGEALISGAGAEGPGGRAGARLPGGEDQGDGLPHGHHVSFLGCHAAQHAGDGRLDLHRDLVGLDL